MFSRYEWFLATKLLLRAHRQRFIPLVAILSVAGIALGVAALIIIISVMSGFEEDLQKKVTAMSAHIWIQAGDIAVDETVLGAIRNAPEVEAAGLYANTQALLKAGDYATGAIVIGLDDRAAEEVVRLESNLARGRLPDFSSRAPEILLGAELASSLRMFPGDSLDLLTAHGPNQGVPLILRAKVVGTFEVGMYDYDAKMAYLPLHSLRGLMGASALPGAMVRVTNLFRAREVSEKLKEITGRRFHCRDWAARYQNLFYAIKIEKMVMFLILLTIVTVAAFNITSSLIMTVMEKTRAIGILGALGIPPSRLRQIFLIQGVSVGAAGVLAGVALGLAVCGIISLYPLNLPGGGSVYYLTHLPVKMNWILVFVVIPAVALALCLVSALYPAQQAAKLDPIEAIRYE